MSGFSTTPNFALKKPVTGADDDMWGTHWNQNADALDTLIKTVQDSSGVKSFNTRAGAVTLTLADVTGAGGAPSVNPAFSGGMSVKTTGNDTGLTFLDGSGAGRGAVFWQFATGSVLLYNQNGGGSAMVDQSANFSINGGAYKPGGGAWSSTSDARIKDVQGEYESGLTEVIALRPVRYRYKGNDAVTADAASPHAAVMGQEFIGLIAQEVEPVMPEMARMGEGFIDGEPVSDLRSLDTTALLFALVNAVKALAGRLDALETMRNP
jgi:hypothetical protein